MARRKRTDQPIGVGLTTRQAKRKKPLGLEYLIDIDPLTENQKNSLIPMPKVSILLPMVVQVLVRLLLLSIMLYVRFLMKKHFMSVSIL